MTTEVLVCVWVRQHARVCCASGAWVYTPNRGLHTQAQQLLLCHFTRTTATSHAPPGRGRHPGPALRKPASSSGGE